MENEKIDEMNVAEDADKDPTEEAAEESAEVDVDTDANEGEDAEDGNSTDDDGAENDVDFEYDEEGNIVIPDDEDDTDEDEESDPEEHEEPAESKKGKAKSDEGAEEAPKAGKTADDDYAELKEKYNRLVNHAKAVLERMDIDEDDVEEGLIRMTAESDGITKEEYKQKLSAEEAIRAADLKAIQAVFPHAADYKSISDLPNIKRFAELRMQGASPIEAYRATHSEVIAKHVQKNKGGKDHLKKNVTPKQGLNTVRIPASDMKWMREEFPHMSDKERVAMYKDTL